MTRYELMGPDGPISVEVERSQEGIEATVEGEVYKLKIREVRSGHSLVADFSDKPVNVTLLRADGQTVEMSIDGGRLLFRRQTNLQAKVNASPQVPAPAPLDALVAPMPGKVMALMVKKGEQVEAGDPLVVIESMKMETAIRSDRKGTVDDVFVEAGAVVKRGQRLIRFRT